MLTIAGGIILAVVILAFIGPILAMVATLGGFFIFASIILIIILYVRSLVNINPLDESFLPILVITFVGLFIFWLIKNQSKFDYAGDYIYCFFKFKFLRFSKKSRIDYYKNLELEKNKTDRKREDIEISLIQHQEAQELLKKKSDYNKKIKHFNKLLVDLKELELNINLEIFTFSYKEVSAEIETKSPLEGRASSIKFTNQNDSYIIIATGNNFNVEKKGNKKEIINWTTEEIGKILANFEDHIETSIK